MRRDERWIRFVAERGLPCRGERQPDPIDLIAWDHELQLELCDLLESIADGLPAVTSASVTRVAAATLRGGFKAHMQFEERELFPMLRRRGATRPWLCRALDQLSQEHEADEDFCQEVAEALEGLSIDRGTSNPDMIGYMLRGFFLSQRRHLEWENTVVLPEARELLTDDDLDSLCEGILSATAWHGTELPLTTLGRPGGSTHH